MSILGRISDAWESVRYAGVGGSKDILSPDYQEGTLGKLQAKDAEKRLNVRDAQTAESLVVAHNASCNAPCPYGFHNVDYQNRSETHACEATSAEIAQDGCAYEGRYATCHNGDFNLTTCPDDFYLLEPPCPSTDSVLHKVSEAGAIAAGAVAVAVAARWALTPIYNGCSSLYQTYSSWAQGRSSGEYLSLNGESRQAPTSTDGIASSAA